MKTYRKIYENVFSSDKKENRIKLSMKNLSIYNMDIETYVPLFHSFLKDFYNNLFMNCVRLSWLRRKFTYYGKKTKLPMNRNSMPLNFSFTKFLRRYIGNDIQIITRGTFFSRIESYFEELFPGFEEGDPFENPDFYKFPFKNISMEFLFVVFQVDDRLEILKIADKEKMSFAKFLDYAINHVYSVNDELGRAKYIIRHDKEKNFPFYIRNVDKILKVNKKKRK